VVGHVVEACGQNVFGPRPNVGKSCEAAPSCDGFDESGARRDENAAATARQIKSALRTIMLAQRIKEVAWHRLFL
jgi:hypothetical protein